MKGIVLLSLLVYGVIQFPIGFTYDKQINQLNNISVASISVNDGEEYFSNDESETKRISASHAVQVHEDVEVRDISGNKVYVPTANAGSGVVVALNKDTKKSLVLTADHVCDRNFSIGKILLEKYVVIGAWFRITTLDGNIMDVDKVLYRDSTDSDALVTSTWTQTKAFLKTYFDTLYGSASGQYRQHTWVASSGGGWEFVSLDDEPVFNLAYLE